jgi:Fe-S-cluster-containing dehydrogenase component/NAD(P)-dependent dehydrogenase (short-subunit alcohol dehydrogenase family)
MSRRNPYESLPSAKSDGAKVFWKSLADKASPDAAQKRAESEFPLGLEEAKNLVKLRKSKDGSDVADMSVGRRGFMFFAGASAALLAEGCARRPVEKILPYSKAPEHVLPGVSETYASVRQYRGDAIGILVESHEGRPTKIEGNPEHPWSLGGTDVWTQGTVYDLYDPDRSTSPMKGARMPGGGGFGSHTPATWGEFDAMLGDVARSASSDGGAKLHLLVEPTNSPTFIRLRDGLLARLPKAQIHVWAPVNDANAREGAKIAFGQVVNVVPSYAAARIILSLDSDFLGTEQGNVRANREFAEGRKLHHGAHDEMNRLYVVEPTFTVTGMNADHRLRLAAQDVERYTLALAKVLADKHGIDIGPIKDAASKADANGIPAKWLEVVAKELASNRAKCVLVAGSRQPARVHALVHALNAALGNSGHTVSYYPTADVTEPDSAESIKKLAEAMEKNLVGTLIILGGNPVYDAPADLKFGEKLKSVGVSVHVSSHVNETSEACAWQAPRAHELEAWGDQRSLDGTVSLQQPLIAPLFGGRSDIEILAKLGGDAAPKGHDLVQHTTRASVSGSMLFSRVWNEALKKGVLGPAARPYGAMDARKTEVATALAAAKPKAALAAGNLEIAFAACPKVFDGRFANNPLLLELPDPVTKVTWDNVASFSEATAKALGLENGDVVRLTREGAQPVDIAAWITPGQADNSIGVVLGWGRTKAGRYGDKHGFDVYGLRTSDAMWIASGVKVQKLAPGELEAIKDRYAKVGMAAGPSPVAGRIRPDDPFEVDTHRYKISQTQEHDTMEGRPVAIDATLEEYRKNRFFPLYPDGTRKEKDEHGKDIAVRQSGSPDPTVPPLWGDWKEETYRTNYRWGMGVDLTSCTGCNACVIACQVENNVPAVGKEQVWRGREMYWLRIDRYFVGMDQNDPQVVFQPVACVQCEEAPCENVCPVNATTHSPEGLNDMAYNRCIGTRYCANNCPYKVRRFNFLNYQTNGGAYDDVPETEKMHYNPNVTVRLRGVMEKCTYCVQRIQEGKIKSKRSGKPIKDGDIVSACQQACPAGAIVFGDLNDPNSKVARWRAKDRSYRLLAELGTRPRTTYLGKIRNPNPEMGA